MKLFDLHCDTLYRAYMEKSMLFNDDFHISFNKSGYIEKYIQCLAVWIPDEYRGENAEKLFSGCVSKLHEQIKDTDIIQCKTGADFEKVKKTGVVLTVESGAALGGKLENIRKYADMGVKMMTLTWNGTNELGDGVGVENAGGLSEFGRKAVKELEKNKIILDISHASEKLFYDVAEIAESPLVASHSNAKKLCSHRRNLTDEQFEIIRKSGGMVGLNFCIDFLNDKAEKSSMNDVLRMAEYFLSQGGEKCIAMGGDFDGADVPKDLNGIEKMADLYEMFLKYYSESVVEDIFFNNAFAFFSR